MCRTALQHRTTGAQAGASEQRGRLCRARTAGWVLLPAKGPEIRVGANRTCLTSRPRGILKSLNLSLPPTCGLYLLRVLWLREARVLKTGTVAFLPLGLPRAPRSWQAGHSTAEPAQLQGATKLCVLLPAKCRRI